jgi:hypothetical protein
VRGAGLQVRQIRQGPSARPLGTDFGYDDPIIGPDEAAENLLEFGRSMGAPKRPLIRKRLPGAQCPEALFQRAVIANVNEIQSDAV